ncbi:MAG: hypothetical protein HUU38_12975 [Anaerolineales bacterium]|jgi:hypothetical protein|nr:hypothetical protein [Anaerolineales bacterium]
MVADLSTPREFTPERIPVRGEIIGWSMAIVILATATVLRLAGSQWANLGLILAVVFILSATSISFGNWMDRKTVLRLSRSGISFANGVRRTELGWHEIGAVRVIPAQWGAREVQVVGETAQGKAHFEFRTLGTVNYQGQERGRTGFTDGEFILETILRMASLQAAPSDNPSYSYYARK